MTYLWNQTFEGFPAGSSQGHTMGEALRRLKAAFYERFIVEHTITESATPTSVHPVGECGVVLLVEEDDTPLSEYIDGALQYKAPAFYRDTGSALTQFLPLSHADFTDLETDAEHPQYVPVGGGDFSASPLIWTVDNLTGLEQAGEQYNARSGDVDATAVQGTKAHEDAAADTYAKHKADCVTLATSKTAGSFYIGTGVFAHTDENIASDAGGRCTVNPSIFHTMAIPDFAADYYEVWAPLGSIGLDLVGDAGDAFNAAYMEFN